jgi:hypothetical protein
MLAKIFIKNFGCYKVELSKDNISLKNMAETCRGILINNFS